METRERRLNHYRETIVEIWRLAFEYMGDLRPHLDKNIFEFYYYVKRLPYIADPDGVETVSRPGFTINNEWDGPRDCDDKTVLILAYCFLAGIPARIVVAGRDNIPRHVYPEISLANGLWFPADATYPDRGEFGKTLYPEKFRRVYYFKGVR